MIPDKLIMRRFSEDVLNNVLTTLHSLYFDTMFHLFPGGNFERTPYKTEEVLVQAILSYLKESASLMREDDRKRVYDELAQIEWVSDEADDCIQTFARMVGRVTGLKVLYVYGHLEDRYSCLATSLRKAFPELKIVCEEYPQENFDEAVEYLSGVIDREKIDLVIGSELGGFIALNLPNAPKVIVVDPCMNPCEELPAIRKNSTRVVFPKIRLASYKAAGDHIWSHKRSDNIMGCFSYGNVSSELLDRFEEHFGGFEMISYENGNMKEAILAIEKCIQKLFT